MIGDAAWTVALSDWVSAVVADPTGAVAVAASLGGDALLLEAATGEVAAKLTAHPMGVLAVSWAPDGERVAVGGQDGMLRVHDRSGTEVAAAQLEGWVQTLAWSPDGRWLAAGAGRRVHLLDGDGALAATCEPEQSTVTAVAWSIDSRRVGAAAYGGVRWYEPGRIPDTRPARELAWKGSLLSLAIAPNGRWACGGAQDQSIHLWKLWSGDDLQMSGYPSKIEHLAFRHDSRWMASACLAELTVWDFGGKGPAGRAPAAGTAHDRHIAALAWEPGGERLATAGADGRVALWPSPRKAGKPIQPLHVHEQPTTASALDWQRDGSGLLIGRADGTVSGHPLAS